MKRTAFIAPSLLLAFHAGAFARGVSPYLPLNLEPEMERQIERVLILGDKPVLTRPIAAATVLDALPKACKVDEALCRQVERYLARYTHNSGITHASVEVAATNGADTTLPNRYGMGNKSAWAASADTYWQPSDYLLVNLGGVAYAGKADPTGSMISLGFSWAQLDLGYRPHWFSPLSDSSMLMSTEAPTMPSVTLSNYEPLTRLGLQYEFFVARMSKSDHIAFQGGYTSGYPRLAGLHLAMEPVSGWSVGLNRLVQFGGGARGGGSITDILRAIINPSRYSNVNPNLTSDQKSTNQEASVTSSIVFPGKTPFTVYAEYAGEDTSRGRNYLLGKAALSVGIHFPRLWERFDFTYETTEWQNNWYIHSVWQDGMVNDGHVVSNWFGDWRVRGDYIGGRSQMARLGWESGFGGLVELRYRTLNNENYGSNHYQRAHDLTVGYSRPLRGQGVVVGGELDSGRDVFGESFTRLAAFVRYDDGSGGLAASVADALSGSDGKDAGSTEMFVDAGVRSYRVRTDLFDEETRTTGSRKTGSHFALGARRIVSEHSDLGTRVELDDINGHSLIGVRLIDYRYRFHGPLAVGAFLGVDRYALPTTAFGFYYGAGVQWRNLIPGWDLGADFRFDDSIARDHLLPGDPPANGYRNDSFYDVWGATLSISHHF